MMLAAARKSITNPPPTVQAASVGYYTEWADHKYKSAETSTVVFFSCKSWMIKNLLEPKRLPEKWNLTTATCVAVLPCIPNAELAVFIF